MKRNYIELMVNLVKEPTKIKNATFIRIAIWNPKIKKEKDEKKEYKTKFLDVSFFGNKKEMIDKMDLKIGQPLNIIGYLSTKNEVIEEKKITTLSVIGTSVKVIKTKKDEEVTQDVSSEEVTQDVLDEEVTQDVSSEEVTQDVLDEEVTQDVSSEEVTQDVLGEEKSEEINE